AFLAAFVAPVTAQTVTLQPTADAHVLSGPFLENLNLGKSPLLEVNHSSLSLAWFEREVYLKFDLSNVTSVRTAKLRLYGVSLGSEIVTTDLLASTDVAWTETGIKWTNKPATGPVLWATTALQDQPGWHEWDISQYLMGEKTMGRNIVTLVLKNSVPTGLGLNIFNSREHFANKPELVIEQAFPWTYYEAETGAWSATAALETGALWGDLAFEARGKQAVTLDAAGEYLEWTNVKAATHAIIRYSIPDQASGTLALYVNGVKAADLPLSSVMMRETKTGVAPPNGGIVKLYDDVLAAIPGGIPAGATVRVQKDVEDGVPMTVDFLEVETAPAPLTKPDETWVEVMQNTGNDRAAFNAAISTANAGSKKVWIPAGNYVIENAGGDGGMNVPAG
ncbi:MAG TPA: DNRLRE domain-containing protein, partial [Opitutus sp.]|nr:DNRLRE domain-containing protein [Opitutus sp.]